MTLTSTKPMSFGERSSHLETNLQFKGISSNLKPCITTLTELVWVALRQVRFPLSGSLEYINSLFPETEAWMMSSLFSMWSQVLLALVNCPTNKSLRHDSACWALNTSLLQTNLSFTVKHSSSNFLSDNSTLMLFPCNN